MGKDLVLITQRKNGQKAKMAVIAAENFEEAFSFVKESYWTALEKAFLAASMSGGLRFTEALNLRPCDLDLKEGWPLNGTSDISPARFPSL